MGMNLNIKSTNMRMTPAIKSYVEEKVALIEKLIDPADTSVGANVEVGRTTKHHQSGDVFRAEINLHIAGRNLRAVSKQQDLYAAIDEMKDDVTRQLRVGKRKRIDFTRRGGAKLKKMIRRLYRRENG